MALVLTINEGNDPQALELQLGGGRDTVQALATTIDREGFVQRRVFVNPASAEIGQPYAGVLCEAAIVFTTEADLGRGNWFLVDVFANGGSAAGGRAGINIVTDVPGGGAGAGAAHYQAIFSREDLIARLPFSMVIPLGLAGGAGVSDTTGAYPANNPGQNGSICSFGSFCACFGGGGGNSNGGGNPNSTVGVGGGGGGLQGAGAGGGTTATPNAGGGPLGTIDTDNSGYGGAGGPQLNAQAGHTAMWGGASGGDSRIAASSAQGGRGGDSTNGCGAGAGGSCKNPTNATPANGAQGGCAGFPLNSTRANGGTGVHGAGIQTAAPGQPGARGVYPNGGSGGGAGGDATSTTAGAGGVANGGAGGDGGFPGGGGGGGGPAVKSVAGGSANSGPGGRSGDACIVFTGFI